MEGQEEEGRGGKGKEEGRGKKGKVREGEGRKESPPNENTGPGCRHG